MSEVIRCDACGGSVVYDAAREVAACLFCASVALHPDELGEALAAPDAMLPFEIDREAAEARFRRWARSSWWTAEPVRRLRVELHQVLLPVWRFDASLETHWAGLVKARTKSGVRPRAGVEHAELEATVPASLGLRTAELDALLPFREGAATRFDDGLPHEVPGLSERAASEAAHGLLLAEHRHRIQRAHRLKRIRASALTRIRAARLLMVPVYIGSFRFRDRPWRFVVNGQTGTVTGRAPLDHRKIAAVVALAVAAVVAWLVLRGS
ncbi:MAG: hypothetical protein H6712_28155 [Myxococcales bacterium]|nr:hypothetical protein [Myxococcales bacterium]MCB9717755.1 hypothetical protein [Myxococcales bacterium]